MSVPEEHPDEFFVLLTDALRAGPGTEPWNKAVDQLGVSSNADEARALLAVRQELESGRSYRSVRPGPMFTHRVMASVAGATAVGRLKWLRWVSLKGIAGMVAASAVVAGAVGGLVVEQRVITGQPPLPTSWSQKPQAPGGWSDETFDIILPGDWVATGTLKLAAVHGLRLADEIRPGESGGLVREIPFPAKTGIDIKVSTSYIDGAGITPEIFLTDDDDYAAPRHEFVWTVEDSRPRVRQPSGREIVAGEPIPTKGQTTQLYVKINTDGPWIDIGTSQGQTWPYLWTGLHHLDINKPWHFGVRLNAHKYGRIGATTCSIWSISMRNP